MRGCSDPGRRTVLGRPVLPADAGVFRARRVGTGQRWRSSPPARGCSAPAARGRSGASVLPADARVSRARRPGEGCASCPPRRRGGAPPSFRIRACGYRCSRRRGGVPGSRPVRGAGAKSSLPTRGCPDAVDRLEPAAGVLPVDVGEADAGVFPCRSPRRSSSCSLLRRRGGVPATLGPDTIKPKPSPPTRGCSVRDGSGCGWASVLPADAGVLRRSGRRRSGSRGSPRRRGGASTNGFLCDLWIESSPSTRGASRERSRATYEQSSSPPTRGCFAHHGEH